MLQTSSTRETRQHARELKFLVSADDADRIAAWARAHLVPDPYGTGPFGDTYRTSTLYFDTAELDVLHRRGSFGRCKYRIRRYDTAPDRVFLERKLRTARLLIKRRTNDGLDALDRLASMEVEQPGWQGEWFRRRLMARQLLATCQVTYERIARITPGGTARLTIDRDVRAAIVDTLEFTEVPGLRVLGDAAIVEMKFLRDAPAQFKQLVEWLALEPVPISKYRCSLEALLRTDGHVGRLGATSIVFDRPALDV